MKILVLKRDKLGDLLLATPLLRTLRQHFPDALIDLCASQYNAWVMQGNRHLSNLYAYPRVRIGRRFAPWNAVAQLRQIARFRARTYDVVIVGQGEYSPRAVKRALWVNAVRTIAYVDGNSEHGTRVTDPLEPPTGGHEAQRMLALLRPLGIFADLPNRAPDYSAPPAAIESARGWLREHGLLPFQFIVLGLGARRPRKQPTAAQIVRWATRLNREYRLNTVLMWTPGGARNDLYPGDDELADQIVRAGVPGLLPFRAPLQPALGMIWQARASVFPDSGLMHFASAAPHGVVGLFGDPPQFAATWHPLGPISTYLVGASVEDIADADLFHALARQFRMSGERNAKP